MLVSVVIPSYNHKQFVRQAIESVLDQSWPHLDLIVIDDGSRDGSPEVIRQLHDERGGFRFVARENRGLLKTLNEGLQLARGEYFCELASDDYFPPDSVEQRVTFLQEHPECVAVFGDGYSVQDGMIVEESFVGDKRRRMFAQDDPIPDMLKGALPVFSTGLIRSSVLRVLGGFDDRLFRYYEDLDTPILLSLQGQLGFLDAPVIYRRHHETNVSGTTGYVRLEKVLCYQKFLAEPRLAVYRRLIDGKLRRSLLALGRQMDRSGSVTMREIEALRRGWRCALRDPRLLWLLLKANIRLRALMSTTGI